MTEDYKKQLINYITDLLQIENPKSKDFDIKSITNTNYNDNEWISYINELKSLGNGIVLNGILYTEKYDFLIGYGAYASNNKSYGFLLYFDKNLNPIKLITETSTGTLLRGILFLEFDEENNRIYGITSDRATYNTSTTAENYFVYFNNLFLKTNGEYKVILNYSYKVSSINGRRIIQMIKQPGSSNYLLVCCNYTSNNTSSIIEIQINVGESNIVNKWDLTSSYFLYGAYIKYDNDNPLFYIICYDGTNFRKATKNGSSISYSTLSTDTTINSNVTMFIQPNYKAINENNIYYVYTEETTSGTNTTYITTLYKYNGNSIETIYKTEASTVSSNVMKDVPWLNIVKDTDNTLYLLKYLSNEAQNTTNIKILNLTKNNVISDDKWINIGTYENIYRNNIFNQKTVLIRNYNICNIFTFSGYFTQAVGISDTINGFQVNIQNLSPINGYTGNPYIDVNVLSPYYTNLYSNGSLVFSRNLYNISKQNNMTMSSVEIPNTYLNDTTITTNDLISETNFKMNSDNTQWTKNIYEVVDLNFLNTISVIDEDTNTSYMQSAIKINDAITDGTLTDYQNTPCTKYRINYTDTTTSVDNISWTNIDDTHKETEITIYVDKAITSIDFISSDESTIYLTIPLQVDVGKYYTINQKIKIE